MDEIVNYIEKAKTWAKAILNGEYDVNEEDQSHFNILQDGSYEKWRSDSLHYFDKELTRTELKKRLKIDHNKHGKAKTLRYLKAAASVIVFALLGSGVYLILNNAHTGGDVLTSVQVEPGKSMAYLQVNNKEKIALSDQDTIYVFQAIKAKVDSGKIKYSRTIEDEEENEYHKIIVPAHGEYFVVLSDGTKVWINSKSTFGYYAHHSEDKRVVCLTGEAYFEVAHDAKRPFVVKTENADINVLGTKFNVKSYKRDKYTYTTLNEGKVRVASRNHNVSIRPNEQVIMNNITTDFEIRKVDASVYSAWANGKLVFKDERLDEILSTLSRWYDVSIFYPEPSLKNLRFSLSTNRYDNISTLLDQMELTKKIDFEVIGNAVIVRSYNKKK
ncbi:MAG: DUF4974 domain-containing protein [Carboxylicivirga sp.]|jgi:hypothetical protein|nr:DUF4974 domain-containing protein [Carboxylicivirga sp.]